MTAAARRVRVWLRRIRVMTVKDLLQLLRDPVLMIFMAYAFTIEVYLAGAEITLDLVHAPTLVHDADRSAASRELLHRFRLPWFSVEGTVENDREAKRALDRGDAMIVLDVPLRFEERLLRGQQAAVQMRIDATDTVSGSLAAIYGAAIAAGAVSDLSRGGPAEAAARLPLLHDARRVWFNPNSEDAWFMSISELLAVVSLFAILLPAAATVREKERGTIEQLLVSPLTPFQILFPKVIAMTLVILAGTAVSLFVVLEGALGVPAKGSLILFFCVTALYAFTTAGLGLFAATVARNLGQVAMLTVLIYSPMVLLSGAWTPPEATSPWIRAFMVVSPLHYYIDATYGILLKGAGLAILWPGIGAMALLGLLLFVGGMWRLRRQFH